MLLAQRTGFSIASAVLLAKTPRYLTKEIPLLNTSNDVAEAARTFNTATGPPPSLAQKKHRAALGTRARHKARTHLELVLLPVDDDGCDLLVHEDEDSHQQCRDGCCQVHPPRVASKRRDKPTPLGTGRLLRARKRKLALEPQYRSDDILNTLVLPAMGLQGDT